MWLGQGSSPTASNRFQCPNAGLLRCGLHAQAVALAERGFSALTLGFFDVAVRPKFAHLLTRVSVP